MLAPGPRSPPLYFGGGSAVGCLVPGPHLSCFWSSLDFPLCSPSPCHQTHETPCWVGLPAYTEVWEPLLNIDMDGQQSVTERDLIWNQQVWIRILASHCEFCDLGWVTSQSQPFLISHLGISGNTRKQYSKPWACRSAMATVSCGSSLLQRYFYDSCISSASFLALKFLLDLVL